jgi:hypothetical protein
MCPATTLNTEGPDLALPSLPGTHRLPSPHCCKGKSDRAFAVTVDQAEGAVWVCHRCQLSGGYSGSGGSQVTSRSPAVSPGLSDQTASGRRRERAQKLIITLPGIEALTVIADNDRAWMDAADEVALCWHKER